MDDKHLQTQLNRPTVPEGLEDRIRNNWKEQITQSQNYRPLKRMLAIVGMFGLIIGILLVNSVYTTPSLVTAAVDDIHKYEKHKIGIALPIASLIEETGINLPMNSTPIKMTKYCTLNDSKTTHIKVAGAKQGEVHLFISRSEFDVYFWHAQKGVVGSMPWRLFKPREDLSVLVLYSHDMNPSNVEKLIQTMFYA